MNLSEIFIRRPIMTTLVTAATIIFGWMSYNSLPISDLPNVDYPTIQVSAAREGASPETMANSVTRPLEKQFSSIAGLDLLTSSSTLGKAQITLQFNLTRGIDDAAQDVEAAIAAASGLIPNDLPNPPSYSKVNPSDQPILYLYLTSATLPLSEVDSYAQTYLAQKLSTIDGVAQVGIYGSAKYAVRIQMDAQKLASQQIGLQQIQNAISQGNVNLPTGLLSGEHKNFTVQTNGQLENAQAYRKLIVSYVKGSPVYLEQLGRVVDSVEDDKVASWYNNDRAIILSIRRQPGTNTVKIVDTITKLLPKLQQEIPGSIKIGILYDASQAIRDSVKDLTFTLVLTVILVVLVIFVFLNNLESTLIPSLALPVSLIGTFAVMYQLNYSLDNLSLLALTLSVGFVVDDAIVMLENIVRHLEMGQRPLEAALNGSREISFTIVSMTLSLVAVFIPMLFMGELLGRLFHEFAVTIAVAILVSGFVSLSLTPMLCSRFLRSNREQANDYHWSERFFASLLNLYNWSLKKALKYHRTIMILSALMFLVTIWLFIIVPKGLIPSEDRGQIVAITQAAADTSFDSLQAHQRQVTDLIAQNSNVEAINSNIGAQTSSTGSASVVPTNSGSLFIRLKPRSQRHQNADEIIQELRSQLANIPGIKVFLQNPPALPIGTQQTTGLYQLSLQSPDNKSLAQYVPQLEEKLKQLPLLQDVNSDLEMTAQIKITINRDKATSYNISASQIETTLRNAYGSYQVSTIYGPANEYKVILELQPEDQQDLNSLLSLYVISSTGQAVPLRTFTTISQTTTSLMVNHAGRMNSATISYNLAPGASLGTANQQIEKIVKNTIPSDINSSFQGASQVFENSLPSLLLLLVIAILVIYLILGILYEDFIHPLTILSGLPSAGFGALVTLLLFGVELNVYSFIGIILLVGIVKKNGIMMVDFAIDAQRTEAIKPSEAIYQACLVRFRPIMMTTMAALMGAMPIALGIGAGSEVRRPLGIAVVGGLIFSQILTLYLTPVVYIYMESARKQFKLDRIFSSGEIS
jgi:hydrophobic/amphiphilic exporter-1 (mainly G- bacteria), HAE1 family